MRVHKTPAQAAQLEVPADEAQLLGRGAAHDDGSAMPSVLKPIGAQAVAQAEQGFPRMLGEFQQPWDPASLSTMPLVLDVEIPLQRVRLRGFILAGAVPPRVQRFARIKPVSEFSGRMWTGQRMCGGQQWQLVARRHCPTFPDSQLSGIRGVHAFLLAFRDEASRLATT